MLYNLAKDVGERNDLASAPTSSEAVPVDRAVGADVDAEAKALAHHAVVDASVMFIESLLNKLGLLPYLRRRWREDQQRSSEKVEARFDRHMATVATRP